MPEPGASTTPRLDRLTSLRFFAALAVVITHVSIFVADEDVRDLASRGAVGVSFFFMLSGFVLTWSHRQGDRPGAFWRRRFARVYPLHLVTWAAAAVIIVGIAGRRPPVRGQVLSLLLLHAWSPDPATYFASNGVSWSLSDEAFFYALFPALLALCLGLSRTRRAGLAGLAVAVALLAPLVGTWASSRVTEWVVLVLPVTQLAQFVIGVVLGLAFAEGWRPQVPEWVVALAVAAGALVTFALPSPWWRVFPMLVPFALVICRAAAADLARTPGWLARPWLVRLGVWSFALYLCHSLLIYGVALSLDSLPRPWVGALLAAVVALAAVGVAFVLHECVERPLEARLRGGGQRAEIAASTRPI